jgi:hypothetical protein
MEEEDAKREKSASPDQREAPRTTPEQEREQPRKK